MAIQMVEDRKSRNTTTVEKIMVEGKRRAAADSDRRQEEYALEIRMGR